MTEKVLHEGSIDEMVDFLERFVASEEWGKVRKDMQAAITYTLAALKNGGSPGNVILFGEKGETNG